ncbi:MAG: type II toxin-antitoxin system VapC family toxin [Thaumarchaeota archaeon]|nr:type II toxin-antitoxin system VapC family toxin [Nitrososphaerota archaeon]MBI3024052.1 type II toxin-antitoxin system VapC family toxin [Nitrososphaerota archaeon]MCS4540149.1 type II toxin-antitoxin system VapC family toxin [Nitrososphaerota archaeon]
MNSRFVIDTHSWVEYLLGSKGGEKAREYIESGNGLTPSIVLAELRKWYLKEIEAGRRHEREMHKHMAFIESITQVVPLDASLALKAGETDFLMKKRIKGWPLADSVIYATARSRAAQVVSGDPHFKGLEDVIFVS